MQNENDNNDRDLLSELDQATEIKTPNQNPVKSWDWGEGDTIPEKNTETIAAEETPANTTAQKGKLSPEKIRQASVASAAAVELLTSLASEGIINLKYYFKFNEEQRTLLDERLLDSPPEKLNQEETALVNRFNRLMKRKNEKLEKVSMSDKARKRMEDAFQSYSELTGEVFITPKTQLGMAVGENVLKAIFGAFLD